MTPYRVLARKYRPTTFSELVGQDVLVRTLTNAINTGRLAHAFLLTGIRGIGKTTTARIIARSLNCTGPEGNGGPTPDPCGSCPNCVAIGEDRHVDVLEMDAASRTGVNDIREIIETVQYAPTMARYKIYIIDEVHMLSNNAFNALLKTLEEPPPHVKFIFATTETRKIPVTILSRCQRFDLARVRVETLAAHLRNVATKENAQAEDEALMLIASAGEGSVRDALSMLDQAIAHASGMAESTVTAALVRDMLGLADKSQAFELLEAVLSGKVEPALQKFQSLYEAGADPLMLLHDMLTLTHFISRMKLVPALGASVVYSEAEREKAKTLSAQLSTGQLARVWQMLMKGLNEARHAPDTAMATEMILIRLMHAAELPTPSEIIHSLGNPSAATANTSSANITSPRLPPAAPRTLSSPMQVSPARGTGPATVAHATSVLPEHAKAGPALSLVEPQPVIFESFDAMVELLLARREMMLYSHLRNDARLVSFQRGRIEITQSHSLPADFTIRLSRLLSELAGERWIVILSASLGEPSLAEREKSVKQQAIAQAAESPLIADALAQFPGARVVDIHS